MVPVALANYPPSLGAIKASPFFEAMAAAVYWSRI